MLLLVDAYFNAKHFAHFFHSLPPCHVIHTNRADSSKRKQVFFFLEIGVALPFDCSLNELSQMRFRPRRWIKQGRSSEGSHERERTTESA